MGIMMMSLVVGKVIITLILDGLFQGKLSNLIIGILMKMNLSQAEADVIYQNVFRANRDVFQWIGFMLLFLVGYYAVLSKTANYLKNNRRWDRQCFSKFKTADRAGNGTGADRREIKYHENDAGTERTHGTGK